MRFRSFLFPLLACGVGGYFAYHLQTGDHGLEARAVLEKRKAVLAGELAGLKDVRARIEREDCIFEVAIIFLTRDQAKRIARRATKAGWVVRIMQS